MNQQIEARIGQGDPPERAAALDYLRTRGTDAPVSKLLSGLRSAFQKIEQRIDDVPAPLRAGRPAPASWSVHEIVDHLVETHRPAVVELRALRAGVAPQGGPIPARLTSPHPFERSWDALVQELKGIHAELLDLVRGADDGAPVDVKTPFVMVVKASGPNGPEVLEWIEALDWKAYAQALRVHTHEHGAQVERTLTSLRRPLQPHLVGDLLELRPLRPDDWEGLFLAASDPLIWEMHPASDRYKEDVFREFFREALESGGALVAVDRQSHKVVGSSRYWWHGADNAELEIGWTFLARDHWGGSYNNEMKRLMLGHAFQFVNHVIFLVAATNLRSRKALEKIGAQLTDRVERRALRGKIVDHVVYEIRKHP